MQSSESMRDSNRKLTKKKHHKQDLLHKIMMIYNYLYVSFARSYNRETLLNVFLRVPFKPWMVF